MVGRLRLLLGLAGLAVLAVAWPAASQGVVTEAWLAPAGDDAAACAQASPCRTLTRAAAILPNGGDVRLLPGRYAWQQGYTAQPTGRLYVHASGSTVGGLGCKGCRNLSVLGGRWAGIVFDGAADVSVDGISTLPGLGADVKAVCSKRVRILNSDLTGGSHGVQGPGSACQSSGLLIDGNHVSGQEMDGIAFGSWDDVTVSHNVIEDVKDPRGIDHNDGVQLYGRSSHVVIDSNRILRPRSQGIIVKADTGPIDDVTVSHNVVEDVFSVPIYVQFATNVRAVSNVVCGGPESDGALWFTDAPGALASGNVLGSTGQPALAYKGPPGANVVIPGGC